MYDYLASKGSRYARLANGVATGESFAGKAAIKFMQQAASEVGKPMGQDLVNVIRQAMAEGYLATIKRIAGYGDGVLLRELNYKEIEGFHTSTFDNKGYSPDAWTLHGVLKVLPEDARQPYMDRVLDAAGNLFDEAALSAHTQKIMLLALYSENLEDRQAAKTWNDRIWSAPTMLTILDHVSNQFPVPEETLIPALSPDKVPLDFINIGIDPSPQPKRTIEAQDAAREAAANGYVVNSTHHSIAFTDGTLDKTDFTSAQLGSLATGGLRPGEAQLDPNVRPGEYLARFYREGKPEFGLGNAVALNALAAQATRNVFVDPLLLDLTGAGVKTTPITDGVLFDIDNSASLKRTGWADRTTGMLVLDDGSGTIASTRQMFSEYFQGKSGENGQAGERRYSDGFAALKSVDTNGDLAITASDSVWSHLRVWVDASHDGVSASHELKTLDELGITSIQLAAQPVAGDVREGNTVIATGTFQMAGVSREIVAVNFLSDPVSSVVTQASEALRIISRVGEVSTTGYVSQATTAQALDAAALNVDSLQGGGGDDRLQAAASGSWLVGGGGSNEYVGGPGDDVFVISASDDPGRVHGNGGRDTALIIGDAGMTLNLANAGLTIAQGGNGTDWLISGGNRGVFLKGGAGGSVLIGGGGNDVLSGGSGPNIIVGGSGKSVIYAGPMGDSIQASAQGSIIHAGKGNDVIRGMAGHDVIEAGHGNATIDGGGGTNIVVLHGSYGEYHINRTSDTIVVSDQRAGRDGSLTLRNVQKLNFSDISGVDLEGAGAMPVADVVTADIDGRVLDRTRPLVLSAASLLANDLALASQGPLRLAAVGDAQGGSVALAADGNVLFTPATNAAQVMKFKYEVVDQAGRPALEVVDLATGELATLRATVMLATAEVPLDPMVAAQWYLDDINVMPVWQDYTGKGVRIGQFEPGGQFSVGAETFDPHHPDLAANADKGWLSTPDAALNRSTHATMVAGVMVAARNGLGGVGVAYEASLAGHYLANDGRDVSSLGKMINYDIANNSWGFRQDFALSNLQDGAVNTATALVANARYAAANGRGGLGTVMVASGGNQRAHGGSAQGSLTNNNRFTIQVAAVNAPADLSTLQTTGQPFSNPGASLLLAAPGSNVSSTGRVLETERGSTFGSDYAAMQGTSFAAPIVSGVVALMLQANPGLGYRDVQRILAVTARRVEGGSVQWTQNGASNWNGAGMQKNDDYGFGKVDARAAVRMAESWLERSTAANEACVASTQAMPAAVEPGKPLIQTMMLGEGARVEHVEVDLDLDVGRYGDAVVTLVSPSGTRSVLLDRLGVSPGGNGGSAGDERSGNLKYTFMSTQQWGELSVGEWRLELSNNATAPMALNQWAVRIYGEPGSNDRSFYFTDEFAALAKKEAARGIILGIEGQRSVFNAAAVTSNVRVDVLLGQAEIAGAVISINATHTFQTVITGDGDDTLIAGNLNTWLDGGRGANHLSGGAGLDRFIVHRRPAGEDVITGFDVHRGEQISLAGFDNLAYDGLQIEQQGADAQIRLGGGQAVTLKALNAGQLTDQHFTFERNPRPVDSSFYTRTSGVEAVLNGAPITMKGGAGGVSFSTVGGQFAASLTGVVHERTGPNAQTYVVAMQPGQMDYKNALKGFRYGVDKLDVSATGAMSLSDLHLADQGRAVINGIALVNGVDVSARAADGRLVKLVYLDAAQSASLEPADFIFAPSASGRETFDGLLTVASVPSAHVSNMLAGNPAMEVGQDLVQVGRLAEDTLSPVSRAPAAIQMHDTAFDRVKSIRESTLSLAQLRERMNKAHEPISHPVSPGNPTSEAALNNAIGNLVDAMAAFVPSAPASMVFAPAHSLPGEAPLVANVA